MQGFTRILLGSAAAVALVSGATVLSTTEASAQFNIEGMIRGALAHGYYGGGRGSHTRVRHEREARRGHHSKESKDAKDDDEDKHTKEVKEEPKTKQDTNEQKEHNQSAQAGGSDHGNASADKGTSQSSSPAMSNTPKQPVAEEVPSLTPER